LISYGTVQRSDLNGSAGFYPHAALDGYCVAGYKHLYADTVVCCPAWTKQNIVPIHYLCYTVAMSEIRSHRVIHDRYQILLL